MMANTGNLIVYCWHEKHAPVNLGGIEVEIYNENIPYDISLETLESKTTNTQGCQELLITCFHGVSLHME